MGKINNRFALFTSIHEKILNENVVHATDIQILKEDVSSNKIEIANYINRLDAMESDTSALNLRVNGFDVTKADNNKVDKMID